MEGGPITVKTANFGNLNQARKRFLQRYKYQPLLSCLAGLYSCRWHRYQRTQTQPGQWCCKVRERVFSPVLAAAFCLSFIFLYLWGEARNDYHNFDWYNYNTIGTWFLWSMVFLVVAALLFSYTFLLVILAVCLLSASQELYLHWSHKVGTLFVLIVSIAALVMITILWNEEWKILRLSFQITAPFFHVIAIVIMIVLAWPVGFHVVQAKRKVFQVVILGPYLALLLFLLFIPLGLYSPCILEKGTLGPKPALIGHRGAPMLTRAPRKRKQKVKMEESEESESPQRKLDFLSPEPPQNKKQIVITGDNEEWLRQPTLTAVYQFAVTEAWDPNKGEDFVTQGIHNTVKIISGLDPYLTETYTGLSVQARQSHTKSILRVALYCIIQHCSDRHFRKLCWGCAERSPAQGNHDCLMWTQFFMNQQITKILKALNLAYVIHLTVCVAYALKVLEMKQDFVEYLVQQLSLLQKCSEPKQELEKMLKLSDKGLIKSVQTYISRYNHKEFLFVDFDPFSGVRSPPVKND